MGRFNEDLNNLLKKRFKYFIFYQVKFDQLILHKNQLKNNSKKKKPNNYKLLKKNMTC
jgi:hypothetical protein